MSDTGLDLHFRCAFTLLPRNAPVDFDEAIALVRRWAADKERTGDFERDWFSQGGRWSGPGHTEVSTAFFEDEEHNQHWAFRYDHRATGAEAGIRWWRTDVGLSRRWPNGACHVSISNCHWIADWVGEEPPAPLPSAPRLVSSFLERGEWQARSGSEILDTRPQILHVGEGQRWSDRLEHIQRSCPLVYLAPFEGGTPNRLDAARLARLTAGCAVVVVGANQILSDELSWTIPAAYRCPDGSARVYLPAIALDDPLGARRHRAFTADRIDLLGPAAVEDMLIVGLARRSTWRPHGETSSLEDIEERRREARFTALRRAQIPWPVSEFTTLFEEENQALTDKNRELHAQTVSLQATREALETDKEDLRASLEEQRRVMKSLRADLANSVMREHRLNVGLKAFQSLNVLPRTVEEVVHLAQLVFPDRLRFTERALRSAKDASINQKPTEMPQVWSLLQAMACVLHELHFARAANDSGDVTKEFESRTSFGLALTETGATKDDADLRKLRRDVYDGADIDITPHVKLGGGRTQKLLRVHYFPHPAERVLVIGHCGDHLETSATRRLR